MSSSDDETTGKKSPRRQSGTTHNNDLITTPPGIVPHVAEESKVLEMTKIEASDNKYRSLSCETSDSNMRKGRGVNRQKSRVKKRNSYGAMTMKKILSKEKEGEVKNFIKSKVFDMVREDNMSILHIAALTTAKIHLKRDQAISIEKYGNFVLIPGTKMFMWWDVIVIISTLFTVIYAPLQIVLADPYGESGSAAFYVRFIVDRLIDLVFLMDVALNFRTARVTSGGMITFDAEATARKYLRGRFVFDLIVAWPWDMVVLAILGGSHAEGTRGTSLWLRTPRLIKLLRLIRFMSISERWEHHIQLSYRTTNGLFIFGTYLLVIHLVGCCWILASGIYDEEDSWVETLAPNDVSTQYSIAVYWAITTMTTIGYGDLTPCLGNNLEMWFTVCVMFLGALFYAFVVGKVAEYVRNKHMARSHFESKVQNLKSYMKYFPNLPRDLKARIYRYCLYVVFEREAREF